MSVRLFSANNAWPAENSPPFRDPAGPDPGMDQVAFWRSSPVSWAVWEDGHTRERRVQRVNALLPGMAPSRFDAYRSSVPGSGGPMVLAIRFPASLATPPPLFSGDPVPVRALERPLPGASPAAGTVRLGFVDSSRQADGLSLAPSFCISKKDLPDLYPHTYLNPWKTGRGPDKGFDKFGELL